MVKKEFLCSPDKEKTQTNTERQFEFNSERNEKVKLVQVTHIDMHNI